MSHSGESFDPYYQWLGIPRDEQPPHHYRLLGLRLFEENRTVIQHAADRQMAHLRTFQNGPRALFSQTLLNEVAAARLCLLSADKKAAYDAQLSATQVTGRKPPPAAPPEAVLLPDPPPPASPPEAPSVPGPPPVAPIVQHRAVSRRGRASRRFGAWLWLAGMLVLLAAGGFFWRYFQPPVDSAQLILAWSAADRADATLQVDGQSWDVDRDALASDADTVTLALTPGQHRLEIARSGQTLIDQSVEIAAGETTRLTVALEVPPDTGTLCLLWPSDQRDRGVVEIDGQSVAWSAEAVFQDVREVRLTLAPGEHSLRITRDGQVVVERSVAIAPRKRSTVQVLSAASRLALRWPISLRDKGSLEIDRRQVAEPPRLANRDDPDLLEVVLRPGPHQLRVWLGTGDVVEQSVTLEPGQTWNVDVERLLNERTAATRPDAQPEEPSETADATADLETRRAEFQTRYQQFEEYQQWAAQQDADKRDELLRTLLAKLTFEARSLPARSPEQRVAYDEAVRLALAGDALSVAQQIWRTATETEVFSPQESAALADRIWSAALQSSHAMALAEYLKLSHAAGRVPTEEEQTQIVDRLTGASDLPRHYADLLDQVRELESLQVLSPAATVAIQVKWLERAAASDSLTLDAALDLAERVLRTIPDVFESGVPDTPKHITTLLGILQTLRRKTIRDAGVTDALRIRIGKIDEGIKQAREWQSQFARIRTARQTLAEQPDSPSEHKQVAFWLLQLGRFREAGPHLRNSGDAALARLGEPIPETAEARAALAEAIEAVARGRYPRRQLDALHAYAEFVRSLDPPR